IILIEYPVSLSYQPIILTIFSITEVICASKIQEWVLPTISMETMGSSVYSIICLYLFNDAFLNALFISSIETVLFTLKVMSVKEPFITGTLMPQPPITLCKSGKIFVSALAAPVVVGTMDCPAALALRKSLWGWSCKLWSVV